MQFLHLTSYWLVVFYLDVLNTLLIETSCLARNDSSSFFGEPRNESSNKVDYFKDLLVVYLDEVGGKSWAVFSLFLILVFLTLLIGDGRVLHI